jgi:hypothetical protein
MKAAGAIAGGTVDGKHVAHNFLRPAMPQAIFVMR